MLDLHNKVLYLPNPWALEMRYWVEGRGYYILENYPLEFHPASLQFQFVRNEYH
jgi:hypothetical protein